MLPPKFFSAFAALAVIAFAIGAGSPKAAPVEIDFGALTPSPNNCATSSNAADAGLVCTSPLNFSANGSTFVATGYSDQFVTQTALTLKPSASPPGPPVNTLAESGLGENAAGATMCTDASVSINCEIAAPASVAVVSNHPIEDAIIGSVQDGENFQFFTGSSVGTLAAFGPVLSGANCTPGPVAETCLITGFMASAIGVQSAGIGNVLLVAVSQEGPTTMPEPATLVVLGTALIGLALARRRRA